MEEVIHRQHGDRISTVLFCEIRKVALNYVSTSQETNCCFIRKASRLLLFREILFVCSKNQAKLRVGER
jgi:hypothetical protein